VSGSRTDQARRTVGVVGGVGGIGDALTLAGVASVADAGRELARRRAQ